MRSWINIAEMLTEGIKGEYQGHGPLWHGTDLLSLVSILESNFLTKSIDTNDPAGASLTHDLKSAWGFADRSTYIFEGNRCHYQDPDWHLGRLPSYRGAILQFDADKLRAKYTLINYQDNSLFFKDDEMEVRVLGDRIEPLSAFLTGFSFYPHDLQWFSSYLLSPFGAEESTDPKQTNAALLALPHNPLFGAVTR